MTAQLQTLCDMALFAVIGGSVFGLAIVLCLISIGSELRRIRRTIQRDDCDVWEE